MQIFLENAKIAIFLDYGNENTLEFLKDTKSFRLVQNIPLINMITIKSRISKMLYLSDYRIGENSYINRSTVQLFCLSEQSEKQVAWNILMNRLCQKYSNENVISINLNEVYADLDNLVQKLYASIKNKSDIVPMIYHFKISADSPEDIDTNLFSLFILGHLIDSSGRAWRKRKEDLYIIESCEVGMDNFPILKLLPKSEIFFE